MRTVTIMAALALAACSPPAASTTADTAAPQQQAQATPAPNNCPAAATSTWTSGGDTFSVAANAAGADCTSAQATIVFKNGATTAFTETYPVNQVMTLTGAESVADMQRMLTEWINPPGAAMDSTGDLPEWKQGAESPMNDEFPFHPEDSYNNRAAYQALRAGDAPMFCFVQGMESQTCLYDEHGSLRKIGVQQFPG